MNNQCVAACPAEARWRGFFDSWRAENVAEWEAFFVNFKALADSIPQPVRHKVDLVAAEHFFTDFKTKFDCYRKEGGAVSLWSVASLKADEVRTCAVLAWLLDRRGSHGQGDAFLRCFLDCVYQSAPKDKLSSLPTVEDLASGYISSVEQQHEGFAEDLTTSRVDIEVNGKKFMLFVEAKVYAQETNDQLDRYLKILHTEAVNKKHALVFLTIHGYMPVNCNETTRDEVISLRWKQVASSFTRYIDKNMDRQAFGSVCIRQFCEHITNF